MAQGICSGSNAKQLFRSYRFILLLLSITFWACAAFYVQYYSRSTSHKGVNQAFLGHERMPKQDDRVNADKKEDDDHVNANKKEEDDRVNKAVSEEKKAVIDDRVNADKKEDDDHVNADKKEEDDRVNKAVSEEKKAVIDDRVNADKKEDDHVNADQKKEDDRVNKAVSEEKKAVIDDRVNADKKEDDHVNADQKKEDDRVNKAVSEEKKPVIPKDLIGELRRNSTAAGSIVGPFDSTEDRILEKRPTGSCDENGEFARVVRGMKFVVVLHELSMTGAPISMMELATELLLCEANVSVVVLNKKGGLMAELVRRKIKVVKDTKIVSFKTAVEADVVIPGTAVCASWIEQYRAYFPGSQSENIAWWIMENLRQYYEMSRYVLNRVKVLIFLTEPQSKEWLAWCKEDNIKLDSQEILVAPLSVNDELASVAGISSSSDTSSSSGPEVMLDKRKELRKLVREEMGLKDSDVVVMCLGSINTVKGQLLFLESAAQMIVEKELSSVANITEVVSDSKGVLQEQTLKILIGSLWSGSTAWRYLEAMLRIIYQHPNLSKLVLWTPTTTRVVALYSVADVYVTNSQTKFGETFGRVTIEAMAFGLPVLGTDAGGTANIVDHNKTGLLHPLGHEGNQVLAQNLQFLLENPIARQEMGARGREKVEKMYLKRHMLEKLAGGISRCKTTI